MNVIHSTNVPHCPVFKNLNLSFFMILMYPPPHTPSRTYTTHIFQESEHDVPCDLSPNCPELYLRDLLAVLALCGLETLDTAPVPRVLLCGRLPLVVDGRTPARNF